MKVLRKRGASNLGTWEEAEGDANARSLGWERSGERRKKSVTVAGKREQEVEGRQGKCSSNGGKIL